MKRNLLLLSLLLCIVGCPKPIVKPVGIVSSISEPSAIDIKLSQKIPTVDISKLPKAETTYKLYVVEKGDCLWRIAGKVYGDNFLWPVIWTKSNFEHRSPDCIFIGERLKCKVKLENVDKTAIDIAKETLPYHRHSCGR